MDMSELTDKHYSNTTASHSLDFSSASELSEATVTTGQFNRSCYLGLYLLT